MPRLTLDQIQLLEHAFRISFFPRPRRRVLVHGEARLFEPFSQHPNAHMMPLGAYSYAQSAFLGIREIGRYCSIGRNVVVMGDQHPLEWMSSSPVFYSQKRNELWGGRRRSYPEFRRSAGPIEIGHDVWVGDGVMLKPGIRLGTGCVIGARSIVTHDVAPYTVVAGSPARVLRRRFDDALCDDLLASRWWELPLGVWDRHDPRHVQDLPRLADEARARGEALPVYRRTLAQFLDEAANPETHMEPLSPEAPAEPQPEPSQSAPDSPDLKSGDPRP